MPLVPAKCTSCGDIVEVDNDKDAAVCPSCGMAFIVEKAINNFGTIIQGQNIHIENIGDGITKDSLLQAALIHLGRSDYYYAIDSLDDALRRADIGPLFNELRLILGVMCKSGSDISSKELLKLTKSYMKSCEIWLEKSDSTISKETADQVFKIIQERVHTAWETFVKDVPSYLSRETQYSNRRKMLLDCVERIFQVLEWGKTSRRMLQKESSASPLRCRSYWAEKGLSILVCLSICYSNSYTPSSEEVQKIYDWAAQLDTFKGKYRTSELASTLIPLQEGGEGVHIRRMEITKDGKTCMSSANERDYFRAEYAKHQPEGAIRYTCAATVFSFFTIWMIPLLLHVEGNAPLYGASVAGVVVLISSIRSLQQSLSDNCKILYNRWLLSPVQGTANPNKNLDEFLAWLDVKSL